MHDASWTLPTIAKSPAAHLLCIVDAACPGFVLQCLLPEHAPELAALLNTPQNPTSSSSSSKGSSSDSSAGGAHSISSTSTMNSSSSLINPVEGPVEFGMEKKKKKKMLGLVPGPGTALPSVAAAAATTAEADTSSTQHVLEGLDAASLATALLRSSAVKLTYTGLPQLPLSAKARNAVMYRVSKKQLLWDVVLATGVSCSTLVERAAAAAVAAVGGGDVGGSTTASPPWV